mmetsp:Transcript_13818/g.39741  ORF Transcript_13818/g.39741 Transcript_13818/m.39741 type:complete len:253 (-) Transcript_13818:113-871(-)
MLNRHAQFKVAVEQTKQRPFGASGLTSNLPLRCLREHVRPRLEGVAQPLIQRPRDMFGSTARRSADDGDGPHRCQRTKDAVGDAVYDSLDSAILRAWIIQLEIHVGKPQGENIRIQSHKSRVLVEHLFDAARGVALHQPRGEPLHRRRTYLGAEIQIERIIDAPRGVVDDPRDVLVRRLDKVHRRHVGNRLSVCRDLHVQGHAIASELVDAYQWRDNVLGDRVQDQHLVRGRVVAGIDRNLRVLRVQSQYPQ